MTLPQLKEKDGFFDGKGVNAKKPGKQQYWQNYILNYKIT